MNSRLGCLSALARRSATRGYRCANYAIAEPDTAKGRVWLVLQLPYWARLFSANQISPTQRTGAEGTVAAGVPRRGFPWRWISRRRVPWELRGLAQRLCRRARGALVPWLAQWALRLVVGGSRTGVDALWLSGVGFLSGLRLLPLQPALCQPDLALLFRSGRLLFVCNAVQHRLAGGSSQLMPNNLTRLPSPQPGETVRG